MPSRGRLGRAVLAEHAPGIPLYRERCREDQHDQADQGPVSAGRPAPAMAGRPGPARAPGRAGSACPGAISQNGSGRAKGHEAFRGAATCCARAEYGRPGWWRPVMRSRSPSCQRRRAGEQHWQTKGARSRRTARATIPAPAAGRLVAGSSYREPGSGSYRRRAALPPGRAEQPSRRTGPQGRRPSLRPRHRGRW